jgi:L-ectoine synthase
MIVRTLDEIIDTPRHVSGEGWQSRRILLKSDGMGFSLHDTIVKEGSEQRLHYKHHFALDQHDQHILRALVGDLRLVCIFNPPLTGREKHQADGSYALPPAET